MAVSTPRQDHAVAAPPRDGAALRTRLGFDIRGRHDLPPVTTELLARAEA